MAKVATPRPVTQQRTRSRTSVSEHSETESRGPQDLTFSPTTETHHVWHCDIKGCSKFFMREADLRRHQRTSKQHNSKAYYCGCGRSFTRQDATRRHCLSFGHDIPVSVLRGIPDDGPPVLSAQGSERPPPVLPEESNGADGIALLVAAAASLSSFAATAEVSDAYSSEPDADGDDDDTADLTSSSASSSQFLAKPPPAADRTPVLDTSRKRKFTFDDDSSSLDLASSWSSDSFPVATPASYASSSPEDTGPFSVLRPRTEFSGSIRRSNTFDLPESILSLAAATLEANDRPLSRTKRSRSLLDATLDFPISHPSRLESRSESATFPMSSPLRAQYA